MVSIGSAVPENKAPNRVTVTNIGLLIREFLLQLLEPLDKRGHADVLGESFPVLHKFNGSLHISIITTPDVHPGSEKQGHRVVS